MHIRNQRYTFPEAILRLKERDGHLRAQFFTNDPPEAIRDDFLGNSFYFDLVLDVPTIASLPHAIWHYKAPTSDVVDGFQGIFLEGPRFHLQPQDVQIRFEGTGAQTIVYLTGKFLRVDRNAPDGALHEVVPVMESIIATVQIR